MLACKYRDSKSAEEIHSFIDSLYFMEGVTLEDCLSYGFIDMGGGYVAYRDTISWLYIAGNLRTRKVFDFGILNDPEYIRADAVNTSTLIAFPFFGVDGTKPLDSVIDLFLESPFSHLFEIRKCVFNMNVYVLPKGKAEEFIKLCRSVRLKDRVTDKQFKEAGFTNYYEPIFYYCKGLACEDTYPVSFNIEVDKKSRKIKAMGVLDDNFLQPHFVDEPLLNQVKNHIDKLINFGILEVV